MTARLTISIAVLAALLSSACCNRELPGRPTWYLGIMTDYHITPKTLERRDSDDTSTYFDIQRGSSTEGDPFSTDVFDGFVVGQSYGFWLDVKNSSQRPLVLLWPEARYVDELGEEHEVYQQPRGALPDDRSALTTTPPQKLGPGGQVRPTIVPLYKQYQIGFQCRDELPYSEPLIPTDLRSLAREEAEARVQRIFEKQMPVKLVLPVEVEGERYDYIFSFTLHDWVSDLPEATPEELEELEQLGKEIDALERDYPPN